MSDVVASINSVSGFRAAGINAGLKADGQNDMALILADRNCSVGAVFTKNIVKAAPVVVTSEHVQSAQGRARAIIVNTVSANAATGLAGIENARTTSRLTADRIGCEPEQVFVMSTGVIGQHLPMEKIVPGIEKAYQNLGDNWLDAAKGIMTTDTRPKLASIKVRTFDGEYTIAGISKGSGMIAPNMATMLGIIVTDAKLTQGQAQTATASAANVSFNRIIVDGDTSTNDMVVLLASGASGVEFKTDADILQFQNALNAVMKTLAQAIVLDGEGATKFITVTVTGAASDADAHTIASTVATSPLVKTAFYGNDANWGRIMAAAGRAGIDFDPNAASLRIAQGRVMNDDNPGLLLFKNGMSVSYDESDATAIISSEEVFVGLSVGDGAGQAVIWTCDLSHDYVSINADYRS